MDSLSLQLNLQRDQHMAATVIEAFSNFLTNTINLDSKETKTARNSRDWLVQNIHKFPTNDKNFPFLYSDKDIFFGSFARNTKKRALDDIDIMICLHADFATYAELQNHIEVKASENSNLSKLCFNESNTLNSKKVINSFIKQLKAIPQYEKAEEISRNQEAAKIKLKSYDWNFDIVPCFYTTPDYSGKTYYVIPDGDGNWKKTDPRIDRDKVSSINQAHDGNVLNVIRIMKYWNKRPTMPSMSSYLLESMILDYYSKETNPASRYVDIEIPKILHYLSYSIFSTVEDPKRIQGNLNSLSFDDQSKISARAFIDYQTSLKARSDETNGDHKGAIKNWSLVLGNDFPAYYNATKGAIA